MVNEAPAVLGFRKGSAKTFVGHVEKVRDDPGSEVMETTTRLASMVFIILVGATAFGLAFRGLGGDALILSAMGFDPLWYGVLLGINLQTSFLTPPFGSALFYFRGVAPSHKSPSARSTAASFHSSPS